MIYAGNLKKALKGQQSYLQNISRIVGSFHHFNPSLIYSVEFLCFTWQLLQKQTHI